MRIEVRTGTWRWLAFAAAALAFVWSPEAQLTLPKQGETLPSFEVSTVKASADSNNMFIRFMPDAYTTQNIELRMVIRNAYGATSDEQIVGGPEALLSKHFDVNAKVDADLAASLKKMPRDDRNRQMALMLQSLLADRFHLQVHIETKEMAVYALVVAKGGPKLKESAPAPPPPADSDTASAGPPAPPPPPSPDQPLPKQLPRGNMMMRMSSTKAELTASAGTMDGLAKILANQPDAAGRQIIDKTGLTGKYDYSLEWTPAGMGMAMKGADNGTAESGANPDAPGLFTALEEQLGLKIEPDKGPVQVVVIDHLEAPTAN
jgi:uncharacterized protein (TIGR03435 family)